MQRPPKVPTPLDKILCPANPVATWRWALLVYFVVLTTLTHWPQMDVLGPGHTSPDKMVHFLSFGLLASLFERSRILPRGWMVFVVVCIWTPFDEWSQQWFANSRTNSIEDVVSGWLGIVAAGVVTLLLRPSHPGDSQWQRAIDSIDAIAAPRGGGLVAAAAAVIVTAVTFPLLFGGLWAGLGWSMSTPSALLAIAIGLIVAAPLTRRAWRRVGGPRWPSPPRAAWMLIWLWIVIGWVIGYTLATWGIEGLMTPAILFGGFIGYAQVIRIGWKRSEVATHG